MKFNKYFLLLILEILISTHLTNAQDNKWILAKDKDGIIVLTYFSKDSNIIGYMATMTVKESNINNIIKIIDNVNEYKNWFENLKYAKTLKKINANERYDYYLTYLPWPFENRDIIFHQTTKIVNGTIIISLKSVPGYIPKKEKITRINYASGYWKIIPEEKGKIKIIYQLSFDPEYNFPDWVLKMFIVDAPYQTLVNLKDLIK